MDHTFPEFLSPWPRQIDRNAEEKLILVKGTKPFPDHDDLAVSCLFEVSRIFLVDFALTLIIESSFDGEIPI